eukprot:gnl/Dysnectes_brevis/3324_a4175_601.p1 GENE.gnl/Dysnectes_brevis/3324_a4175_601~~gnl/Dysnectes_brevis/3324_a4175_601.p1  ORF type:complete len:485 (+),score=105.65 gnl/Dysnectes_brevis/3324_a4175_601:146-1456(+)
MSAIYVALGADESEIPLLWIAAPLTGMIVQPLVGYFSDNCRSKYGRRKPFFAAGAVVACPVLLYLPHCSSIGVAVICLCLLDSSINVSMEPMRSLLADCLPTSQITLGYAIQATSVGIGSVLAAITPYILRALGISGGEGVGNEVRVAFAVGAIAYAVSIAITCIYVTEVPAPKRGESSGREEVKAFVHALTHVPEPMLRVSLTHALSWLGMFTYNLYYSIFVAGTVFGGDPDGTDAQKQAYQDGITFAGLCNGLYNAFTVPASILLPKLSRAITRRGTHALALGMGCVGMLMAAMTRPGHKLALVAMTLLYGFNWSSMLATPYAIIADVLKNGKEDRTGMYFGVFNLSITIPEIVASLSLGSIVGGPLNGSSRAAVGLAGVLYALASFSVTQIRDPMGSSADASVKLISERRDALDEEESGYTDRDDISEDGNRI